MNQNQKSLISDIRKAIATAPIKEQYEVQFPKMLRPLAKQAQVYSEYQKWSNGITKDFLIGTLLGGASSKSIAAGIPVGIGKGVLSAVNYDYDAARDRIVSSSESGRVAIHNPLYEGQQAIKDVSERGIISIIDLIRNEMKVGGVPFGKVAINTDVFTPAASDGAIHIKPNSDERR